MAMPQLLGKVESCYPLATGLGTGGQFTVKGLHDPSEANFEVQSWRPLPAKAE